MDHKHGILFEADHLKTLRKQFFYLEEDPAKAETLFFDNSGGALRLKKCVEAKAALEAYPDCPERSHERAEWLKEIETRGTKEILEIIFGADDGALITELTASQTMFRMVEMVLENVAGGNAVVSSIEHPSAFDAVAYYCRKTGKEMRVIPANSMTGGIDPEEVEKYVDADTCLLSIISASNLSGAIINIDEIVRRARKIKPDLYILTDAVQHAPHCGIHVKELGVDGMNFAPYKFFGVRGCGFAYVSERMAALPHPKLLAKEQKTFTLGTSAPGNFAAAMEIINYVCSIGKQEIDDTDRKKLYKEGMKRIHLQERALLYRMLEGTEKIPGLRYIDGVQVCNDTQDLSSRDLIAAISFSRIGLKEAAEAYQKRGIIVCERLMSSMYSARILEALGLQGAIRVSPLHCHGVEEIDRFLEVTAEIAKEK